MEEGLTPEVLKMLAGYVVGEVVALAVERQRDGRLVVKVESFDLEAQELNLEEGGGHDEFFTLAYILERDGSRVVEVHDADGNLLDGDPRPWGDRPPAPVRGQRDAGPRARLSALAGQEAS